MKTARGRRHPPVKIQPNSEKLPDLMRLIQSAGRARHWKVKIFLARRVLTLHRRRLWVGEDPDRPDLLLIIGPGEGLGKVIGFHIPMNRVVKSGLLTLVGEMNNPQFKP